MGLHVLPVYKLTKAVNRRELTTASNRLVVAGNFLLFLS